MNYDLSIVIPCFNEYNRLPYTMDKILKHISYHPERTTEIILVENGSRDSTYDLCLSYASSWNNVRAFSLPIASKALAIQEGMHRAVGDYRFMCDADLSMPITDLEKFWAARRYAYIVTGWRVSPLNFPVTRRVTSWLFKSATRLITGLRCHDTQCGFKLFHASAADYLFPKVQTRGFTFDIEVLVLAELKGFTHRELPINWIHDGRSTVRPLQDGLRMLRDLFYIRHIWDGGKSDLSTMA